MTDLQLDLFGNVRLEREPAPAAAPARGRARAFVPAWERERRRENTWRRQQRRADRPVPGVDYDSALELLDRSIVVWRAHLERERLERASRVAAGGG